MTDDIFWRVYCPAWTPERSFSLTEGAAKGALRESSRKGDIQNLQKSEEKLNPGAEVDLLSLYFG